MMDPPPPLCAAGPGPQRRSAARPSPPRSRARATGQAAAHARREGGAGVGLGLPLPWLGPGAALPLLASVAAGRRPRRVALRPGRETPSSPAMGAGLRAGHHRRRRGGWERADPPPGLAVKVFSSARPERLRDLVNAGCALLRVAAGSPQVWCVRAGRSD